MKLRLRFFASHRDALGQEGRPIKMPEGSTAQHLFDRLASEHPALAVLDERTLFAVNHEQAPGGEGSGTATRWPSTRRWAEAEPPFRLTPQQSFIPCCPIRRQ